MTKEATIWKEGIRTYTCTVCGETKTESIDLLTSYTIPDGTTEIRGNEFRNCENLTSVIIPDSVAKIGGVVFWGCTNLTSITIPNSVTEIGDSAFWECSSPTNVMIPDSVSKIESNTFSGCSKLNSITLQGSITSIGVAAFRDYSSLTDVYYDGFKAQWNAIAISDDNDALNNATIHFAKCVTHTYDSGTVTKDSTITTTDEAVYVCTACGETKTETIPKLDNPRTKFNDLSSTGFYLDAVAWALDKNVTTGTTATTFSPRDSYTHGQILTFLWRAAGSPASNAVLPFETTGSEYYLGAAKWAYEKGMIDETFNHKTPCTRAYAVLYIWEAFGQPAAAKANSFTDMLVHWSSTRRVCNRDEIVTFLYRAYRI